jgi:hypothetical protein
MSRQEPAPREEPFWHLNEVLGEFALQERASVLSALSAEELDLLGLEHFL